MLLEYTTSDVCCKEVFHVQGIIKQCLEFGNCISASQWSDNCITLSGKWENSYEWKVILSVHVHETSYYWGVNKLLRQSTGWMRSCTSTRKGEIYFQPPQGFLVSNYTEE